MKSLVSVIIRTLNEEKYLPELLQGIHDQQSKSFDVETIVVDSGSTDSTVSIARKFGAKVICITKNDFTFGRSLNIGCEKSNGSFLVFVSGHCVPVGSEWLEALVQPLLSGSAYTYGRQVARDTTKFSEEMLFQKYFPKNYSAHPHGIFCNNANAALKRELWASFKFDESLPGCEDLHLANQIVTAGLQVKYVPDAPVYHVHNETWDQVRKRYQREAIAIASILPEINFTFFDLLRFFLSGAAGDFLAALRQKKLLKVGFSVIMFRWAQYCGTYNGFSTHRRQSKRTKEKYFHPKLCISGLAIKL